MNGAISAVIQVTGHIGDLYARGGLAAGSAISVGNDLDYFLCEGNMGGALQVNGGLSGTVEISRDGGNQYICIA